MKTVPFSAAITCCPFQLNCFRTCLRDFGFVWLSYLRDFASLLKSFFFPWDMQRKQFRDTARQLGLRRNVLQYVPCKTIIWRRRNGNISTMSKCLYTTWPSLQRCIYTGFLHEGHMRRGYEKMHCKSDDGFILVKWTRNLREDFKTDNGFVIFKAPESIIFRTW